MIMSFKRLIFKEHDNQNSVNNPLKWTKVMNVMFHYKDI